MATGGGNQTPLSSDGLPAGGGRYPQVNILQVNMTNPDVQTPHVAADSLRVQGPCFFTMNPYTSYQPHHSRPVVGDESLYNFPEPEDVSDRFTEEELSRVIEEKYLSYVANCCDEKANWRRLSRKLKLDAPTVNRLEVDHSHHIHEFIYQLLLAWKRRNTDYRVHDLIKALSASKLQKPALELKKYFSSIH